MATVHFPAVIDRDSDGYSVSFPDLPGCVSGGDTLQQAARNAEEALSLHLLGTVEDGDTIPAPSDLDAVECEPGEALILVRADLPGRKTRVNVMIDEGLLSAIDAADSNRSRFIDKAVRVALAAR